MNRLAIAFLLAVVGIVVAHSQEPQESKEVSVKPKNGFVPNAETAVKIAEAVLIPVYGEATVNQERPFKASRQGDVWRVTGTLNCGAPQCTGGTAVVRISETSGEILFMGHYK
jgi:NTF2 fold immunity protein of polymorphic toxin system component